MRLRGEPRQSSGIDALEGNFLFGDGSEFTDIEAGPAFGAQIGDHHTSFPFLLNGFAGAGIHALPALCTLFLVDHKHGPWPS